MWGASKSKAWSPGDIHHGNEETPSYNRKDLDSANDLGEHTAGKP